MANIWDDMPAVAASRDNIGVIFIDRENDLY